ncbi:uncharacterized protein LOC134811922 isoform X2 [Bolinopsis microptera]|uniref:uncharacterized protein LOC134811922 isoform X2 n=1 Tax=Bolinopsis microptera TaxID=2820187 RepID=UPI003078C51B
MADRSNLFDVPSSEKQSGLLKPTPDLVAEIYATAGKSFSRLAELTARLHKIQDPDNAAKARAQVRDMIRSENLASKRTSLFEESEYSKSPPKESEERAARQRTCKEHSSGRHG